MVEPVSAKRTGGTAALMAALVLMSVSGLVMGQGLKDPTKPPTAVMSPAGRGDANGESTPSVPVLQSVLVSPGRTVAIVSGHTVTTGEKFGDAQVVKITETAVVLRKGNDLQTLKLFPNIEKRAPSSRVGGKSVDQQAQ